MSRKDKIGLGLVVILILMTAVNFQFLNRYEREKFVPRHFGKKLPELNKGRLFTSKRFAYAPDQILVKFKPSVSDPSVKAALSAYKTQKMKRP